MQVFVLLFPSLAGNSEIDEKTQRYAAAGGRIAILIGGVHSERDRILSDPPSIPLRIAFLFQPVTRSADGPLGINTHNSVHLGSHVCIPMYDTGFGKG